MLASTADLVTLLREAGWTVELLPVRAPMPDSLVARYPWMPAEYRDLAERAASIVSSDERAWILTVEDFAGRSASAFAWNEWERLSLDAADQSRDANWKRRIEDFWNQHLPFLMSVAGDYAYLAFEKSQCGVVGGHGPDFEETSRVTVSLGEVISLIARRDPAVVPWT